MKKHILFIAFLCIYLLTHAQNLVLNPGFENINTTCSGFGGAGFTNLVSWDNPDPTDTCSTPDWFSTCLNSFFPTSAPTSWLGYQNPRTGDAYAGIILYDATTNAYREYLEGTLASPLVAGQTYCVSFYVSLADTVPYAVNKIGVYFSNTFVQFPVSHCINTVPLPFTPQLQYNGAALTDTANWVRIEWQYVATGGEQYFVIGNFLNNAGTTVTNTGGSGIVHPYAYYFVDDVSVVPGICCDATIASLNTLCTNGSPITLSANSNGGTWSGNGITSASAGTFNPQIAGLGTHIITYTLPCGANDTIAITVNNCMEACINSNGDIAVNGGVAPYSWQQQTVTQNCSACLIGCNFPPGCAVNTTTWNTYATGNTQTPPATFPIRVLDGNGGTLVINSVASLPACSNCQMSLSVANVVAANCGGNNGSATISATNGTAPYTYSWNNGQTGATLSNVAAGNYNCIVTDASNCQVIQTVTIGAGNVLTVTANIVNVMCSGDKTGSVTLTATGTPPYAFSWSTGSTNNALLNIGAGNYTCTVTDAVGCITPYTATVTQSPPITPNGTTTPNTGGGNGTATVNPSGGNPPYTYTWNTNPPQYTPTIAGLTSGNYTCNIYDASGCVAQSNVIVGEASAISGEAIGLVSWTIAPNPSNGIFEVKMELKEAEDVHLVLYDMAGKEIAHAYKPQSIQFSHQFELAFLSKGIYLLQIQTAKGQIMEKLKIE